jgi:ABC-2 type transport system ATP-binding protein
MNNEYVIETHDLTKVRDNRAVVQQLNLRVAGQKITGFLGPNGAGKSTTIKMLLGLVHPTSGSGRILESNIAISKQNQQMRREIAYVAEDKILYDYMTVEQLIHFTRSFYTDWSDPSERRLVKKFQLPLNSRVRTLSKGMRTKLALLLALARLPKLLILDEPSEGLDPLAIEDLLQEIVAAAADGTTVFFSSHQIAEVERIADRVCILDRGSLIADLSMDQLRQDYRRLTCGFTTIPPALTLSFPGIISVETSGRQISILASHGIDATAEYVRTLGPISLEVTPVGLKEVFFTSVKESK